ncbi:unnamed protein product [Amoebophrya sp. A25]|nr:unnamed protein product [Amoebophrya sp. A25]|eukprot:GSA25T00022581001.1
MIAQYARGSPALSSPSSTRGTRRNKTQELYEEAKLRQQRHEERDAIVRLALQAHVRQKTSVSNPRSADLYQRRYKKDVLQVLQTLLRSKDTSHGSPQYGAMPGDEQATGQKTGRDLQDGNSARGADPPAGHAVAALSAGDDDDETISTQLAALRVDSWLLATALRELGFVDVPPELRASLLVHVFDPEDRGSFRADVFLSFLQRTLSISAEMGRPSTQASPTTQAELSTASREELETLLARQLRKSLIYATRAFATPMGAGSLQSGGSSGSTSKRTYRTAAGVNQASGGNRSPYVAHAQSQAASSKQIQSQSPQSNLAPDDMYYIMMERAKVAEERLEEMRKLRAHAELAECSFQPNADRTMRGLSSKKSSDGNNIVEPVDRRLYDLDEEVDHRARLPRGGGHGRSKGTSAGSEASMSSCGGVKHRTRLLYERALIQREEAKRRQAQKEFEDAERETEGCTFHPETSQYRKGSPYRARSQPRNFDSGERMRSDFAARAENSSGHGHRPIAWSDAPARPPQMNFAPSDGGGGNALFLATGSSDGGGIPHNEPAEDHVKGYSGFVERNRRAQAKRQEVKEREEYIPVGERYEELRRKGPQPFNLSVSNRRSASAAAIKGWQELVEFSEKPDIIVEVKMAPGKLGRIALYCDDDPLQVVTEFCKHYALDDSRRARLEKTLRSELSRVQHESGSVGEDQISDSMPPESPPQEPGTSGPPIPAYSFSAEQVMNNREADSTGNARTESEGDVEAGFVQAQGPRHPSMTTPKMQSPRSTASSRARSVTPRGAAGSASVSAKEAGGPRPHTSNFKVNGTGTTRGADVLEFGPNGDGSRSRSFASAAKGGERSATPRGGKGETPIFRGNGGVVGFAASSLGKGYTPRRGKGTPRHQIPPQLDSSAPSRVIVAQRPPTKPQRDINATRIIKAEKFREETAARAEAASRYRAPTVSSMQGYHNRVRSELAEASRRPPEAETPQSKFSPAKQRPRSAGPFRNASTPRSAAQTRKMAYSADERLDGVVTDSRSKGAYQDDHEQQMGSLSASASSHGRARPPGTSSSNAGRDNPSPTRAASHYYPARRNSLLRDVLATAETDRRGAVDLNDPGLLRAHQRLNEGPHYRRQDRDTTPRSER